MSRSVFTKFSNLLFSRNNLVKGAPVRFSPGTSSSTGASAPKEAGKGKGPVTWKSLSVVVAGGIGLLVSKMYDIMLIYFQIDYLSTGFHVLCER
jgi:hypothetical protein